MVIFLSRKNTVGNILRETFSALGVVKKSDEDAEPNQSSSVAEISKSDLSSVNEFVFPSNMSKVDSVRYYVYISHLVPAKKKGQKTVTVHAGDIRESLNFNDIPTICSALKIKIDKLYDVKILSINPKKGNRIETAVQYDITDMYMDSGPTGRFDETGTYAFPKQETKKEISDSNSSIKPKKTSSSSKKSSESSPAQKSLNVSKTKKASSSSKTSSKFSEAPKTISRSKVSGPSSSSENAKSSKNTVLSPMSSETSADRTDDFICPEECYMALRNLEELLRSFVTSRLESQFGKQWWNKTDMGFLAQRWDERRIIHDRTTGSQSHNKKEALIMYASFSDYRRIINNPFAWKVFEEYFPDRNWIVQRLKELDPIRNAIMHHTMLEEDDILRLNLYSRDIQKSLDGWLKNKK